MSFIKKIGKAIVNFLNKVIIGLVVLGIIASSIYGIAQLVQANDFVKYGLGFLVVGFAVEFLYRNLIKKPAKK